MRADLAEAMADLHPKDAKRLGRHEALLANVPAGEEIVCALPIVTERDRGPLVLTDRRLTFIGERFDTVSIPTQAIHGYRLNRVPDLFVAFGGDEVVFGVSVVKRESLEWFIKLLELEIQRARSEPAAAVQSAPGTPSVADEIDKFAALRDRGVISQEEFDAKKAQLLGL